MSKESSSSPDSEHLYDVREITYNLRDSIVYITSQSILEDTVITVNGNGFLIMSKAQHYIICPSTLVLLPESSFSRFNTILVEISNVNGQDKSYSYLGTIIGVDGSGNIAILSLDMNQDWNKNNPPLKNTHPSLQWGKSRNTSPGDRILIIGDIIGQHHSHYSQGSENGVAIGNIADNRYVHPTGKIQGELLLLNNILIAGRQCGLPIITSYGKVIGMMLDSGAGIALAEFFMRRSVKAFIAMHQTGAVQERYSGFIEKVNEPLGIYYRYNKSSLGLNGTVFTQLDYITRYSTTTIERVNHINIPHFSKEIVGYRITNIDDTSPLKPHIVRGDIIIALNECPLGDRKKQISPSMVMWRVPPGSQVSILYKKQADNFEKQYEVKVVTLAYDLYRDYPGMGPLL